MQGFWGDGTTSAGGMDNGVDNMATGGMMDWGSRGINSMLDPMNVNGMLMAGENAIGQGYGNAMQGMSPFQQGGLDSFNQWKTATNNQGNYLNSYQNMGAPQWATTQMSAPAYYQNIMQGYQMSPQAQYNQQVATRAGNSAAAASGMMGSGAFMNGMQRNANQISQGDQQQYFNNVMGANQAQLGNLQNYQNQYAQYLAQLQGQSNIGYGAAGNMGNWGMQYGQNMAGAAGGMLGNVASIAGSLF